MTSTEIPIEKTAPTKTKGLGFYPDLGTLIVGTILVVGFIAFLMAMTSIQNTHDSRESAIQSILSEEHGIVIDDKQAAQLYKLRSVVAVVDGEERIVSITTAVQDDDFEFSVGEAITAK